MISVELITSCASALPSFKRAVLISVFHCLVYYTSHIFSQAVPVKWTSLSKKNQLDVTYCILYFSSNSCSTCFGQPCTHHQEMTTAWCIALCWYVPWLQEGGQDRLALDVTFCILYFSSTSCSTYFGQPCAHHQELTTAW